MSVDKAIDIKHDRPWYHGVKWRKCYSPIFEGENWGIESSELDEDGDEIIVVQCASDLTKRNAELIASAPETATDRDKLKAENETLARRVIAAEKLAEAASAFRPYAQVAFLWTKEKPSEDDVERYRASYYNYCSALIEWDKSQ